MLELNRQLDVKLGFAKLDYYYTLYNVGRDTFKVYLRAVDKSREIMKCLPSSSKGVNDVRVWVTGPWKFGDLPSRERPFGRCLRQPREVG